MLIISRLFSLTYAQPYEAYPINKQYPPVARIDESFSFQLSNTTYQSSNNKYSQITYQVFDLPEWLTFDTQSRTISGSPSAALLDDDTETDYFNFILQGFDETDNSYLNNTYQLAVTKKSSLQLANDFNLLALLKNYGNTNGKEGLILAPNQVFNVTFDRSAFVNQSSIKAFYGRSEQYNAPLPNWLFFDSSDLRFSGTAPVVNSAIAPEFSYGLVLIATDIEGYSGIEVPFNLIVGAHQLTTSIQNSMIINVTDSGDFNYDIPLNYVFLDNNEITMGNLSTPTLVNAPDWVQLNNFTLSGSLPSDTSSSSANNFSVAIYDIYDDVIYLNFDVVSTTNLFAVSSLPNINATRNEWFQYSFLPSQFTDPSNTNISVFYTNSSQSHDWLSFHSSNLTLIGQVPNDFDYLSIGLRAQEKSLSEELSFKIIGMDSKSNHSKNHTSSLNVTSTYHHSSTTSTSHASSTSTGSVTITSTTASSSSSGVVTPIQKNHKSNNSKTVAIACGVAIPVGVIIIIAILLFMFWKRKQNNKSQVPDEEMVRNISKPDVNNPANDPKQAVTSLQNPFDDDSQNSQLAKRLTALNEMKLDQSSLTDSENSTIDDEKNDTNGLYADPFHSQSDELLLKDESQNAIFNPTRPTSSFYMDSQPATMKSWKNNSFNPSKYNRDSSMSLNTVTTADLMNTEIKEDDIIPKDPRKSSLGLRDSVFWNKSQRNSDSSKSNTKQALEPVAEFSDNKNDNNTPTSMSTSSSDDFLPVKNGDNFDWVRTNDVNRKPSKKRLVNFSNKGEVDVGEAQQVDGHIPEEI